MTILIWKQIVVFVLVLGDTFILELQEDRGDGQAIGMALSWETAYLTAGKNGRPCPAPPEPGEACSAVRISP